MLEDPAGSPAAEDPDQDAHQDVAWIVDIEIQTREGNQAGKDKSRNSPALVDTGTPECRRCCKRETGMTGGKGIVRRSADEQSHRRIHIAGPDPLKGVFHHQIAENHFQANGGQDHPPCLAGVFPHEQERRKHEPDKQSVRDRRHQHIQQGTADGLNRIQDLYFYAHIVSIILQSETLKVRNEYIGQVLTDVSELLNNF